MKKIGVVLIALTFSGAALGQSMNGMRPHPDYVPDERTAETIAQAVLIARFGEDRVKAQLPLHAVRSPNANYWIVQGTTPSMTTAGGLTAVIDEHSGCIEAVMTHMK
jgi:hypothetical protein